MLLITNEVCTSGAESKPGPSKDHPDLGMKLLKDGGGCLGKGVEKNPQLFSFKLQESVKS